jgi:hypothetical protein
VKTESIKIPEVHAETYVEEIPEVHAETYVEEIPEVHAETYVEEIYVETFKEIQECQAEMIQQKEQVAIQKEPPQEKVFLAIQKMKEYMEQITIDLKETECQRQTILEPKQDDLRCITRLSEQISAILTKQNQNYIELIKILE